MQCRENRTIRIRTASEAMATKSSVSCCVPMLGCRLSYLKTFHERCGRHFFYLVPLNTIERMNWTRRLIAVVSRQLSGTGTPTAVCVHPIAAGSLIVMVQYNVSMESNSRGHRSCRSLGSICVSNGINAISVHRRIRIYVEWFIDHSNKC